MSAHGIAGPQDVATRPRRTAPRPEQAPVEARPPLRLVAGPGAASVRRRRRLRLAFAAAAFFVVAVVFGLVGMHVLLAQNQFRLDRLHSQAAAEEAAYQRLRLQVDQLESPQRIVAAAEGRLGMVQPASVTYLSPAATQPAGPDAAGAAAPAQATPSSQIPAPSGGPAEWAAVKPQLVTGP